MATTYRAGSGSYQQVLSASIHPSSIPGANTSVETFKPAEFAAITNDSWCKATLPALEAGLVLESSTITATGTLTLVIRNATGGSISPAAQTCQLIVY